MHLRLRSGLHELIYMNVDNVDKSSKMVSSQGKRYIMFGGGGGSGGGSGCNILNIY